MQVGALFVVEDLLWWVGVEVRVAFEVALKVAAESLRSDVVALWPPAKVVLFAQPEFFLDCSLLSSIVDF